MTSQEPPTTEKKMTGATIGAADHSNSVCSSTSTGSYESNVQFGEDEGMTSEIGENKYSLEETLAQGAFATVFLASSRTYAQVAIKQLTNLPSFTQDVSHEFFMTRRAAHKNVVTALEHIEENEKHYIVYELAEGGDMYDWLERAHEENPGRSVCRQYLLQAAEAVAHCHMLGIVHSDIKLENILICTQTGSKLCDFGLAGFAGDVRYGKPFGTSPYMAPEIVHISTPGTEHTIETAHDVWSFGIILYAVLFNDLPWEKAVGTDSEYASYINPAVHDDETSAQMEQLAPDLWRLLKGMLEPNPAARVTMAEVVAFLSAPRYWFVDDIKVVSPGGAGGAGRVVDAERTPSASPAGSPGGSPQLPGGSPGRGGAGDDTAVGGDGADAGAEEEVFDKFNPVTKRWEKQGNQQTAAGAGAPGKGRGSGTMAVPMPTPRLPQMLVDELSDEDGTPSSWASRQAITPLRLVRSFDDAAVRRRSHTFAGTGMCSSAEGAVIGNRIRSSTLQALPSSVR